MVASSQTECRNGQVCILARPDSFEIVTRLDSEELSDDSTRCVIDHPIIMLAAKAGKYAVERKQGKEDEFYYFKELIVLTDVEPCFMCAMALVHSRVSTVIFRNINAKDGALVSQPTEIHCLKQLNHSFSLA